MLDMFNMDSDELKEVQTPSPSQSWNDQNQFNQSQGQNQGYQGNNQGQSQGYQSQPQSQGYQNQSQGWKGNQGNQKWQRKSEEIRPAYTSVAIYYDKDFPDHVKNTLLTIASRFIATQRTVRYNAMEKEDHDKFQDLSREFTEAYAPWKGFNGIDTKFGYHSDTSKAITKDNFSGYDKVHNVVQAILASNTRMIFGERNNSNPLCLITWSPDGVTSKNEVTKETGKPSYIINLASKYGIPIVNIQKDNAISMLEKIYNI